MAYDFKSLTKQADEAGNRKKFYTDFEDVDPNVLHQISDLTEWIRTKGKGSDVREVIAQLFERTWLEGSKEGNANMEVAKARGEFDNLSDRLFSMIGLLNTATKGVDGVNANKVDKGGAGQVTWSMLAQDARTQISGSKTAVVGANSVSTDNIVNKSITNQKLKKEAINVQFFPSYEGEAMYNHETKILDFNNKREGLTAAIRHNEKWISTPVGATLDLSVIQNTVGYILIDTDTGSVSVQTASSAIPDNAAVIGRVRFQKESGQRPDTMFEGPIANHITIKGKLTSDSNFEFCPSKDGLPWLDLKRNRINFNCVTDQAYINYNSKSYQITKNAYCDLSGNPTSSGIIILNLITGEVTSEFGYLNKMEGKFIIGQFRKTNDGQFLISGFPTMSSLSPRQTLINDNVKLISHRGYNVLAPEETEDAYILASAYGFNRWECDVHFTSDGIAVLHHDDTINNQARNPDGSQISKTIFIKDVTYNKLLEYDFGISKSNYFKGSKIMKFEDFVSMARRYNVQSIHVELKEKNTSEQRLKLYEIVKNQRMLDKCGWQSFHESEIKGMAEIDENIQLEILGSTYSANIKSLMKAVANGKRTVVGSFHFGIDLDLAQQTLNDGFDLYIWTCDTRESIKRFNNIAVTGFMTNGSVNVDVILREN